MPYGVHSVHMSPKRPPKAIAYARASMAEQEISVDVQRERLKAYAQLKGMELVEFVADPGVSSKIRLGSRLGGGRLLRALTDGRAKAVMILRLDRAFRNTVECLGTVDEWDRKGISLHVLDMGGNAVDVSTATGRFALTVLATVAEMERSQLRERTRAALHHLRANGKRISGRIPFGYDLAADGVRLLRNRREQQAVRLMLKLRRQGASLREVARQLTERGFATKSGAAWSAKVVAGIVRRETECERSATSG